MAKYSVQVTQTVVEETLVFVVAGDESEAEKLAVELIKKDPGGVEWNFVSTTDDDYEATATEEANAS